ncbi:energy transducer TonB [Halorhodospira abdelmalekii]|uniref:energy transducer TonB n=1 Tax=Halorhodospira abdelmalekii TaxID=421629 RepID=UPI001904C039|nr:energy transducer TonB [Halorhodospira abdelmalekii]
MNRRVPHASLPELDGDRLGMSLFLAVTVHALVVLGVGLTWELAPRATEPSMMEVTLAQIEAERPPEEADFLADLDQDGGGFAEEAQIPLPLAGEPVPPLDAPSGEPGGGSSAPPPEQPQQITAETAERASATETAPAEPTPQSEQEHPRNAQDPATAEIAELQRRLSQPREPSKRFLNARTRAHDAAAYMEQWTRKVERIGNLNYPDEARNRGLSGRLILEVTLMPDGSLDSARIVQPSRYHLLDEAAVRIVKLGAPFAEVPEAVMDGHDRLVITRTWEFVDGEGLRTQ